MEEKLYGFRGILNSHPLIEKLADGWEEDGVAFSIKDGIFEVKFSSEDEETRAREIAGLYIKSWEYQHGIKLSVNLNHSWKPQKDGGTAHNASVCDTAKCYDRVMIKKITMHGESRIVTSSDSSSFSQNQSLVEKCLKDKSLRKALEFYSEEVVDNERPLYGIYKALEEIAAKLNSKGLNGRDALAKLAGEGK